jgi:transcription initiation factor TFIIIB Brf1 subunit/transcription initiation factor TFIIB
MNSRQGGQVEACPVCETEAIDASIDSFDGVCTECGFVIHDSADPSAPDWLVVRNEETASGDEDWLVTCRVQNATEQRLAEAFEYLEDIADRLRIPAGLRRDAADIYCEAFLAEETDGRDTNTMVAACVRLASLQDNRPIPTGRLTESSDIDSGQFHRNCSVLCDELDHTSPTPEPADYLLFLDDEFTVDEDHLQASTDLLEDIASSSSLVGKDPSGIAAAALYVTGEELTQADVAEAVGVSTETVRNRVAQLRELITDG